MYIKLIKANNLIKDGFMIKQQMVNLSLELKFNNINII